MKRRLLRVEMERRRSEDMRKERERGGGKTMDELRAASSRSRLARAGFRRPPLERRASIMHIGGCDVSLWAMFFCERPVQTIGRGRARRMVRWKCFSNKFDVQ